MYLSKIQEIRDKKACRKIKMLFFRIFRLIFFIDIFKDALRIGEGTLPWAIFRFRIFSNCFSQKFKKIKITV